MYSSNPSWHPDGVQRPCNGCHGNQLEVQQQAAPAMSASQQHPSKGPAGAKAACATGNKGGGRPAKRLTVYKKNCMAISRMKEELARKLSQAATLEAERSRLQAEHQLLVDCCHGLQLLKLKGSDNAAAAQEVDSAAEELPLLQQLQSIPYPSKSAAGTTTNGSNLSSSQRANSSSHSSNLSSQAEDPDIMLTDSTGMFRAVATTAAAAAPAGAATGAATCCDTEHFSPPGDLLYLYRHLLSLPPFPGAETMTCLELVTDYVSTVHKLALQLHLVGRPGAMANGDTARPVQKIKALLIRHLHIVTTLLMLQRTEVIESFVLTNFETGETYDEHPIMKHVWVIEQMQLTKQQKLTIAHAMDFFKRMLAPTIEERQRLQQEVAQQKEHLDCSSSDSSSGSSSREHQKLMAERDVMLRRLSTLLRKEYLMRMAASAAVAGGLTCVQMATCAVQMTPHPFSLQMIGMLLQQQQQQQQQQNPAQG